MLALMYVHMHVFVSFCIIRHFLFFAFLCCTVAGVSIFEIDAFEFSVNRLNAPSAYTYIFTTFLGSRICCQLIRPDKGAVKFTVQNKN